MEKTKRKNGRKTVTIIAIIYLLSCLSVNLFGCGSANKEACKAAELHVQSDFFKSTGEIPATKSKVIYKNDSYICVAVKYSLSEKDLKDDIYWVKVLGVTKFSNVVMYMSSDITGLDYDHIPDEFIDELKAAWELE